MKWREARIKADAHPVDLYDWLDENEVEFGRVHQFWDEPWWPGAFVVRIETDTDLTECDAVDNAEPWDWKPDAEHFGERFDTAMSFFQASTALNLPNFRGQNKMVHCFLNAQGMSRWDEFKFAVRYAWGTATLPIRWRLYMKRRYEREQEKRA